MATAADLTQAAGQAFENLFTVWNAGNLQPRYSAFWQAINATFPDSNEQSRPVSNWIIPIAQLADTMGGAPQPFLTMNQAVQYIYRICMLANQLNLQGLVTNAQAAALLAAYNAQF